MKYIKMFIAGMIVPAVILPLLLFLAVLLGRSQILGIPFLHFIPLIWGVWNILYFTLFTKMLPEYPKTRLLLAGGVLGFLIAAYGVVWLNIPALLGFPKSFYYLPLLLGPILYALLWLFVVKPLNRLLGVQEDDLRKF